MMDVGTPGGAEHLRVDGMVAEELSIRYADATRGHRSGHFAGIDEYVRTRERCLDALISSAARDHAVQPQDFGQLIGRRAYAFDSAVLVAFAALYLLACQSAVRALVSRFPLDERTPAIVSTFAISATMSASGTVLLGLWAEVFEMLRVADGHMSYRVGRSPWTHHTTELFVAGAALFVFCAVRCYRQTAQGSVRVAA